MRRHSVGRHAAGLGLVALLALASSTLGADGSLARVAVSPAPTPAEVAAVEAATAQGIDPATLAGLLPIGGAAASGTLGPSATPVPSIAPASPKPVVATPKPAAPKVAAPKPAAPKPTSNALWWTVYHGVNHVWMPTLGVSKPVYFYACGQSTYPANVVYRWGCGGTNNTYLFGHNFGVFSPLYNAWLAGTLRVGLPVVYADASGHVHLYRVTTWRLVSPTDTAWATASQPVPSMTLQTCGNAAGTTRLLVRLVVATK